MLWVTSPVGLRGTRAMDGSGSIPSFAVRRGEDALSRVRDSMAHKFPHFLPVARRSLSALVGFCDGWQRTFPARQASGVVPELTTWERFLSTEPRTRRIMLTVQPLGVDTSTGTWAPVLLAQVARWHRDTRGRRYNQPTDVWLAGLGREGLDARQRVSDDSVLTVAVTSEGGGFRMARLPLDDAQLTPEAVAGRLAACAPCTLAEARRAGWHPQVVVDVAGRGRSAWTSHLLTTSTWLGARVEPGTGSLELAFDHLVMDGSAMMEVSRAIAAALPRKGRAAADEWLTGAEDPSPLLRVELPERLDFRNLACASLVALGRSSGGLLRSDNPTMLVPVLPDAPSSVARPWRRIRIAVIPTRTSQGPVTPEQVSLLLERTRGEGGVLEDIFSTLYSPALPWWMPSLTTHGFAFTPGLRQVATALCGNALLSKITIEVEDEAALERHLPIYFNTMRPLPAVGGGVSLCVTEVLCATRKGVRKRFFGAIAGSGPFTARERLTAFRTELEREVLLRARPPISPSP
ncbi:hypothetical protein FJV41_44970 [Myxococcus llanfairpwllgwyngyllgogerychwyrndrobwllllantysiliogogogochensis]|uniref:Uncharacterized protein n=2 Tax=Myxococcus llanfairpwllgwyngyllgogerychwyrndrobwllllantysiliogogogochensis TaxID=2590453 RepID=A0A540WK31_9BACT|nr:hypothetical protein FJV41_44970 [Myxococcus llanfairpwllgwyngyllgogerychwyrndrobwllllantysiliogogogochensis]